MTSEVIKKLMEDAAAPEGMGDEHWLAAGIDRLHFYSPSHVDFQGIVEVRRGEDVPYVRLEVFCQPELAATIIALVTRP